MLPLKLSTLKQLINVLKVNDPAVPTFDYKVLKDLELTEKTIKSAFDKNELNIDDDVLSSFSNYYEKKLFNQNRFILSFDKSELTIALAFLSNLSFSNEKQTFDDLFTPKSYSLDKKIISNCVTLISYAITHSLKTINTNFYAQVYVPSLNKSEYGIDSSLVAESFPSLPFSTTEGNASLNSKYPLFFFNFVFDNKVHNIISLCKEYKDEVFSFFKNYFCDEFAFSIFEAIDTKNDIQTVKNLGYQTIIDISSEYSDDADYITISPIIPISMLHSLTQLNSNFINSIQKDEKTIIVTEDKVKNSVIIKERNRYFVKKNVYAVGGTKPQNVNPYFSYQSGIISALNSTVPKVLSSEYQYSIINKMRYKNSLLRNLKIQDTELKRINSLVETLALHTDRNKMSVVVLDSIVSLLMKSFSDIISDLLYAQDHVTIDDLKSYFVKYSYSDFDDAKFNDFMYNVSDDKMSLKLNIHEKNFVLFLAQSKDQRRAMNDYIERGIFSRVKKEVGKLNIPLFNSDVEFSNQIIKRTTERLLLNLIN